MKFAVQAIGGTDTSTKTREQLHSDANDSMGKTGNNLPRVEMPLCFYAGLRHIQAEKRVAQIQKLNPDNVLAAQLDLLSEDHALPFVKTKSAAGAPEALKDAQDEGIIMNIPKDY